MREVPELMERSPQEARERWLRLTGRLEGVGAGGAREPLPGSPLLDNFYLQVEDCGLHYTHFFCDVHVQIVIVLFVG